MRQPACAVEDEDAATGDTVASVDQFDSAVTSAVNRARDALDSP